MIFLTKYAQIEGFKIELSEIFGNHPVQKINDVEIIFAPKLYCMFQICKIKIHIEKHFIMGVTVLSSGEDSQLKLHILSNLKHHQRY